MPEHAARFFASSPAITVKINHRQTIFLARLICCVALVAGAAAGFDFTALKPDGYVTDFARVLDGATEQQLEKYCGRVEAATGAQMALVTIPTLGGEPIEDVANAIFRKWGIGQKGKNEGIMLLLVVRDRRSRLEIGYGLEPVLPDGLAGSILRQMRPALRENHYGDALKAAAESIGSEIARAKGVSLDTRLEPKRRREPEPMIPWPVLAMFGLMALMALLGRTRRRYYRHAGGGFLPGVILGNLMGHSWGYRGGGHGHGGFGGYDSGDTFGGFGGGDSGGGGASSDW